MKILNSPLPMEQRLADLGDALANLRLVVDEARGLDPRVAYHADVTTKKAVAVVDLIVPGLDAAVVRWRRVAVVGWILGLVGLSLPIVSVFTGAGP